MKETFEFRISYDFATKLFSPTEGKDLGQITKSVKVIYISKDDPRFDQIPIVDSQIRRDYNRPFYFSWRVHRKYSKKEVDNAIAFNSKITKIFEPAGEECGTEYDEDIACEICGSNRKKIGRLNLKKGTIPRKDIACTIAGEIIVSERFKEIFQRNNLKGLTFEPINYGKHTSNIYEPIVNSPELSLTEKTIAGIDPFNFSESEGAEIYKCPKGHTIGLNLLSEAYVADSPTITEYDFFATKQKVGVNRGLLRPQPLYICSQAFRQMVLKEKLSGFDFEVAHIDK